MPTINPRQVELFYLRLLLLHVRGAQSYEDLRTVTFDSTDGPIPIEYETFRDAASALGLLENDQQWHQCLEEAR